MYEWSVPSDVQEVCKPTQHAKPGAALHRDDRSLNGLTDPLFPNHLGANHSTALEKCFLCQLLVGKASRPNEISCGSGASESRLHCLRRVSLYSMAAQPGVAEPCWMFSAVALPVKQTLPLRRHECEMPNLNPASMRACPRCYTWNWFLLQDFTLDHPMCLRVHICPLLELSHTLSFSTCPSTPIACSRKSVRSFGNETLHCPLSLTGFQPQAWGKPLPQSFTDCSFVELSYKRLFLCGPNSSI